MSRTPGPGAHLLTGVGGSAGGDVDDLDDPGQASPAADGAPTKPQHGRKIAVPWVQVVLPWTV